MTGERRYSRIDRVNESLREVIADELERIDDERLELVTVTGVKAESDLRHAHVWFDTMGNAGEVAGALGRHRVRLQAAIGRQLHFKRTPELTFSPDPAIAVGTRVEEILRGLHRDTGQVPDQAGRIADERA
ncbi:MAG: 30S ribosome-binding factor RbfA [Actinobacteria bacterium]|nr:30S ribosome-binding factor RbfA [Actinomycetota bacterium]